MKHIKIKNTLTIIFDSGATLVINNCDDELYKKVVECGDNEKALITELLPELSRDKEEYTLKEDMLKNSKYLIEKDNALYIRSISDVSVPENLAIVIFKAEKENNEELIQSYLNFWTLCSTNPDKLARHHLYSYLKQNEMIITKSGMFVGYKNVIEKPKTEYDRFIENSYYKVKKVYKKNTKNYYIGKDKNDNLVCTYSNTKIKYMIGNLFEIYNTYKNCTIYTDSYSKSTEIIIGKKVSMDRSLCDSSPNRTCSTGLHIGSRDWLKKNIFGDVTLLTLINPADVVAIPYDYISGKMRVCAYYPIEVLEKDADGSIPKGSIDNGYIDNLIDKLNYNGNINNEEWEINTIKLPKIVDPTKEESIDLDALKEKLTKKIVK